MNVHWTSEAILNVDAAVGIGSEMARELYESTNQLVSFPHSGRKVPEVDNPAIRELIHKKYRIVYEIRGEQVSVLTVFHSSRDFGNTSFGRRSNQ